MSKKQTEFIIVQTCLQMLIRSLLASQIRYGKSFPQFQKILTQSNHLSFHTLCSNKNTISLFKHSYGITQNIHSGFSKQKIIEQLQKFNQELDAKNLSMVNNQKNKEKENEFLQKQQKIIKDFMDLTEESFSEQLEQQLKEKYHVDAEMLLMIVSSLSDAKVIKQTIPKLYPFVSILQKKQLLLLFELIVTHRPQTLPPLSTIPPKPLQDIQSLLLLLNQVYPKEEKLIEWLKQIPLYKGKNVCMLAAGFFGIYEKMEQHVRFKNERTINRCIERVVDLAVDEKPQTQISVAILGLQSDQTGHFADKLLVQVQKIDYSQVDPLKMQLFFIHLQRSIAHRYAQAMKQASKKNRYKVLSQSEQGQLQQRQQQQYSLPEGQLQFSQISQIQKYKFLNNMSKTILGKIIDMNWNQLLKLNLLMQYWKVLDTFSEGYPWNSFKNKLINYTGERHIIKKMTNLDHEEVLVILQVMERLKVNKSQLLLRLLALVSDRLGEMNADQLMRLAKVCVTFVRQCEDYLISVRFEIQNRKFIFTDQQIDQLNQLFKRVLVLFPRPLAK